MSRTKPVDMKTGAITKAERERRQQAESVIRGNRPLSQAPPESLADEARNIYATILENLPLEQMNETDGYTVEVVADAIANMRRCRKEIDSVGLFVERYDRNDNRIREQNVAVGVYQKYSDILKKYIAELGLSPAARSRIASLAKEPEQTAGKKTLMELLNEDGDADEG